ncbi:MAG TPA: hypothetical protein VET85_07980 [Stellaceae bacterium]|nr:hypothetical protein [Stellaceae bacterium]
MPAWWTPDFTYWLLPIALISVPVIAGGIVALGQGIAGGIVALGQGARRRENVARELAPRSTAHRVIGALLVLAGLLEWALGAYQAVLARSLIADYPAEFWRWIGAVLPPILWGGIFCGVGAYAICTRLLSERRP